MLIDIISVEPLANYNLKLTFEDGLEGIINVSKLIKFEGIFASLIKPDYFDQVTLNKELGTIQWPNGADLDPDVLYATLSGLPVPAYTNKH